MAEPICPVDCSTTLPVVLFDKCAPKMVQSELTNLYIAKPSAADFTDVEDATEWTKRLSNTDVVPGAPTNTTPVGDLIRKITIIGDRPAPAAVDKELSNQRTVTLRKDFTINFTIDEITAENLALQRASECGMIVKAWYDIQGGLLFGGDKGINDGYATLKMDLVLARGTDEIALIQGTLTWKGKFTEEGVENPIAA